jgi:hypothetical protein
MMPESLLLRHKNRRNFHDNGFIGFSKGFASNSNSWFLDLPLANIYVNKSEDLLTEVADGGLAPHSFTLLHRVPKPIRRTVKSVADFAYH